MPVRTSLFLLLFSLFSLSCSLLGADIVDPSARDINGASNLTPITTQNGSIFLCYIDGNLDIIAASRPLTGGPWSYGVVDTGNLDDAHNACSLGIDPHGYIHISYNQHNNPALNYKRSTTPYNVSGGWQDASSLMPLHPSSFPPSLSYPVFIRAGSSLLFLYRQGGSGNGDECMNRYDSVTGLWSIVACPMIQGLGSSSPYLAPPRVDSMGKVHLLWTTRIGWLNQGLNAVVYDPATNTFSTGTVSTSPSPLPLSLPLTQTNSETVLPPAIRVSNVGLNILPEVSGSRVISYLRDTHDTWETWTGRDTGSGWTHQQLSDLRLPRLRACPVGPDPDLTESRPCDMQMQGPLLTRLSSGRLLLTFGRTVGVARGSWARPSAITLASQSMDGGVTWSTPIETPHIPPRFCEMNTDSGGLGWTLAQECGEAEGVLHLLSVDEVAAWAPETVPVFATEFRGAVPYEVSGLTLSPSSFSLEFDIYPVPVSVPLSASAPVGLFDKSSTLGLREVRVLLWGYQPPGGVFGYSSSRIQIAVGNSAGEWGLVWYPQIEVKEREWTKVRVVWDGQAVRLYREGVLLDEIGYSGTMKATGQRVVIGGVRSPTGELVRPFSGEMRVEYRH